jgi:hypothetical protein
MGSGSSGNYSGTSGGSQPYADTYRVVGKEMKKDKADPDIYNPSTGYFHNPNAKSLDQALGNDERIYSKGKKAHGKMTYVMDEDGNIIFGKRENPNNASKRAPHPTLIGGKDPKVQCAGMITFDKGRIVSVNNESGHYRPASKSLDKVYEALKKFQKAHPKAFSPNYKGGN